MTEPIELDPTGEKYQTRDGRKVRVLCVDFKHLQFPVIAAVAGKTTDCAEAIHYYTADGLYCHQEESRYDLIPRPRTHDVKVRVVLYRSPGGVPYIVSQHGMAFTGTPTRLAAKEITVTFTEGEGL